MKCGLGLIPNIEESTIGCLFKNVTNESSIGCSVGILIHCSTWASRAYLLNWGGGYIHTRWVVCQGLLVLSGDDLVIKVDMVDEELLVLPPCEKSRWSRWLVDRKSLSARLQIGPSPLIPERPYVVYVSVVRPRIWVPLRDTTEVETFVDGATILGVLEARVDELIALADEISDLRRGSESFGETRILVSEIATRLTTIFGLFDRLQEHPGGNKIAATMVSMFQDSCLVSLDACEMLAYPCDSYEVEDFASVLHENLMGMGEDLHSLSVQGS